MGEVTLKGYIDVPADRLDDIRVAVKEHIRLTRDETGCLMFNVDEDAEVPGRFNVSERFTDADAFRAHQARVKTSEWGRISQGIPRDYVITDLDD